MSQSVLLIIIMLPPLKDLLCLVNCQSCSYQVRESIIGVGSVAGGMLGCWVVWSGELSAVWEIHELPRETGECFMELCKDNKRDRPTLEEIILRRVKPGTHILTDGWAAYTNLPNLGVLNVHEMYSSVVMILYVRVSNFSPCVILRLFPSEFLLCLCIKFYIKKKY